MKTLLKFLLRTVTVIILLLLISGLYLFKKDIPVSELTAKYANADSKFMPLMGMQVHYRDEGNPLDSVPLVLIHGTSSSLLTWDSCTKLLKASHRVIRFDLPAFALTGPNPERDYSFDYYTRFVDSFLLQLKISQCVIAGNSLGGGIAWHYALTHPGKVKKLVLVDASGFTSLKKSKGALAFKLASIPVINHTIKWVTPRFLVEKTLKDVYGNKNKITEQLVDRYYEMTLRAGNRQALIDRMRSGFTDESEKIKMIKNPTLIIWGGQDQLIPVEDAYRFQKAISNSELTIFRDAGHVPMEEIPDEFTKRMLLFIDGKQ